MLSAVLSDAARGTLVPPVVAGRGESPSEQPSSSAAWGLPRRGPSLFRVRWSFHREAARGGLGRRRRPRGRC